ncbi:MAG: T9SS type A sorting domain-containing protein [Chitinivibrionales bacterium]|nr:T9SS type A sorting domain-containing protein [Chitinivibrionales bacterium]MBD3355836.1 T9SS type A sorting domain-containing protein [Chitinivibrionales bacterium]
MITPTTVPAFRGRIALLCLCNILVLNFTSIPDEYDYCPARKDNFSQYNVEDCGTVCPDLVKTDATLKSGSDLPYDGIVAYTDAATGEFYISDLKNHSPSKVMDSNGEPFPLSFAHFSVDGQWIIGQYGGVGGKLGFVKRDGSSATSFDIICYLPVWYYNSPRANPLLDIYEIAWVDQNDWSGYAQLVDMSSGTPTLIGEPRVIAEDLEVNKGGFFPAGDILLWDQREEVDWDVEGSNCEPVVLYTIPDHGMGVATEATKYDVHGCFNCATAMNFKGTMWAGNPGRAYRDCIPEGHNGFVVKRTKRYNDPVVSYGDYTLDAASGAVSVNWCPIDVDNINPRLFGLKIEFMGWMFTNNNDYVAGYLNNTARGMDGVPAGGYLVNWKTNEWYTVVPTNIKPRANLIVYLDSYEPSLVASVTKPVPNHDFDLGDDIEIEVDAVGDGVTKVDIFVNDELYDTDDQAPYTAVITNCESGYYKIEAVAYAGAQSSDTSYQVVASVKNAPELSSIEMSQSYYFVKSGGNSKKIEVVGYDQYGERMANHPSFSWSVSDGGTINDQGVFTSNDEEGEFEITVSANGVSAKADIVTRDAPTYRYFRFIPHGLAGWERSRLHINKIDWMVGSYRFPNVQMVSNTSPEPYRTSVRGDGYTTESTDDRSSIEEAWKPYNSSHNVSFTAETANFPCTLELDMGEDQSGWLPAEAVHFGLSYANLGELQCQVSVDGADWQTVLHTDNISIGGTKGGYATLPLAPTTFGVMEVAITEPVAHDTIEEGDDYTLAATVSVNGPSVETVEFLANDQVVGTVDGSAEAYSCLWENVPSGHYEITVRATNAEGKQETAPEVIVGHKNRTSFAQERVFLLVKGPRFFDGMDIDPKTAFIKPGGSREFTITPLNQYGEPFDTTLSVEWSTTGGGTVDNGNVFTASSDTGNFEITASCGLESVTAFITVSNRDAYRYLRFIDKAPDGHNVRIKEIKWYDKGGYVYPVESMTSNAEPEPYAVVSSSNAKNPENAFYAYDNDESTKWEYKPSSVDACTLTLDLGRAVYDPGGVHMKWDRSIYHISFDVSINGEEWLTALDTLASEGHRWSGDIISFTGEPIAVSNHNNKALHDVSRSPFITQRKSALVIGNLHEGDRYRIFNIRGQTLVKSVVARSLTGLSIHNLYPGHYIVEISGRSNNMRKRILVRR